MRLPLIAVLLTLLGLWLHAPVLGDAVLGGPGTDVFRGIWGFDHQAQAFPFAFWTERIGFPAGVKVLMLPFASSLLGAPLHWLFGPWQGYDLWMIGLQVAGGVSTAWWLRSATGSGAAGLLAGVLVMMQPSLLLALTDGTAEHVAFWGIPLLLGALSQARHDRTGRWGILAGLAGVLVALDSPYNAIFSVPLALWPLSQATPRARVGFALTAVVGLCVLVGLYWGLPLAGPLDNRGQNAVRLAMWWQWDSGAVKAPWDFTYTPAFIPFPMLVGTTVLALLRPARSWPWVALGILCLLLAVGGASENQRAFTAWWGAAGTWVGWAAQQLDAVALPNTIRFPRRWLTPAALCMVAAAAHGLSRLPKEWMRVAVAVPGSIAAVWVTLDRTGFHEAYPKLTLPEPAFATFVETHPTDGAALLLPTLRGANRKHERFELPVFANLDASLVSADLPFLQVAMGRALVNAPQGLFTLQARSAQPTGLQRLLQDLNDLCMPQTVGQAIPPSASGDATHRIGAVRAVHAKGLRFVVLDEAVYATAGMELAKVPFASFIAEDHHFDDGSGVTVWVLRD